MSLSKQEKFNVNAAQVDGRVVGWVEAASLVMATAPGLLSRSWSRGTVKDKH